MQAGEPPDVPFLQNMGLLMTYRCQVACPHCIIEAGPDRTEELSLDDADDWIGQIAAYGRVKVLSLTGGEPFVDLSRLKKVASAADEKGLIVTAVTNAYWAETREGAVRILKALPELSMVSFSVDIYHQRAIPFERVKNAIQAARECGVLYNVSMCTESREDPGYRELFGKLLEITDGDNVNTVITLPAGRALRSMHLRYETTLVPPEGACVVSASPVVFPDGRVVACIGPLVNLKSRHPLLLGNLNETPLREILDRAESNPVLHQLRVMGPGQLAADLRDAGYGELLPKTFVKGSICDLCYAMMSDPKIVEALDAVARDPEYVRKVAYSRVYFLKEARMAEEYLKNKAD